jgi:hypothetical protein
MFTGMAVLDQPGKLPARFTLIIAYSMILLANSL